MPEINYKKLLSKKNKKIITCLTAYSEPIAKILDGRVDLVLVGDSVGTTIYGMNNTRTVTLEMMKNHGKAVVKNIKNSMSIVDMPYGTYRNKKEALENVLEVLSFTGADFIKIETGKNNIDIVKYLSDNKVGVVSHIGVKPQNFSNFSKIKSVGKSEKSIKNLLELAIKLENAGSKLIVLECVSISASKLITNNLSIPTIGIGSSKFCDGQVLVIDDLLGINSNKQKPKFVKQYIALEKIMIKTINKFTKEVKNRKYPSRKYSYK